MKTVVIDYGMGNLASVCRALEECGADVSLSKDPESLNAADKIVLPGVGSFAVGMKNLNAAGWPARIREAITNPTTTFLGICLGMQLLAAKGHEHGLTDGLGLIAGEVVRLNEANGERIPHVGWNEIDVSRPGPLFRDIPEKTDFYFVHSFHLQAATADDVAAVTPYCGGFTSAVRRGNVWGTQFHPEKSSHAGFQLLRNFLEWRGGDA
jgi:glutamine amidotransferase